MKHFCENWTFRSVQNFFADCMWPVILTSGLSLHVISCVPAGGLENVPIAVLVSLNSSLRLACRMNPRNATEPDILTETKENRDSCRFHVILILQMFVSCSKSSGGASLGWASPFQIIFSHDFLKTFSP